MSWSEYPVDAYSVKICGNRDPELCRLAAAWGADMLGFIFVPGAKRNVDPELAAECIRVAKQSSIRKVRAVGVFVDEVPDRINEIGQAIKLDLVQLHGLEEPGDLAKIDLPVLKVIRPRRGDTRDQVKRAMDSHMGSSRPPVAFVLDAFHTSQFGGTGIKADWDLAADLTGSFPIILAGGLTAQNVYEAITRVEPMGVDVSSGVETDGVRDPAKIRAFIEEAKRGFEGVSRKYMEITAE